MENGRRKIITVIIFSIIICAVIFIAMQEFKIQRQMETSGMVSGCQVKAYTIREAVDVMSQYIISKGLIDEPLLIHASSTDSRPTDSTINSGKEGKRADWNGEFGDTKGSRNIVCTLRGAEINIEYIGDAKDIPDNENGEKHLAIGRYKVGDIKLDSNNQIVLGKIKELGIKPGNPDIPADWIRGYHYTLSIVYLDDSENKMLVLRVTGISPESPNEKGESMMAVCEFNAEDGSFIGASKKIGYDKDGHSIWVPM